MRTITEEIFNITELSEDAQEAAYQQWAEIEHSMFDSDFMKDDIITLGNCIGINIDQVLWSGFNSQGDGACFTGDYEYNPNWKEKIESYAPTDETMIELGEELSKIYDVYGTHSITVIHDHFYYHENSVVIDTSSDDVDSQAALDLIDPLLREFMKYSYTLLEKQYEYYLSKEVFIESSLANEYEYYSNGKMYF